MFMDNALKTEQDRQNDWVDKNILKVGKSPKATTWAEVKEMHRPLKAIWEPH